MTKDYKMAGPYDVDDAEANKLGLGYHPGYRTPFCNKQAPGALPNGTVIVKHNSKATDATKDGSLGKVLGSIGPTPEALKAMFPGVNYFYWVEWNDDPGMAIGCVDTKIRRWE